MAQQVYLIPRERENFLAILRENGRVQNFSAKLKRAIAEIKTLSGLLSICASCK